MKKVFSIVAAMMVALFAMVSCGAVKSAQDGAAAGKEYAQSFQAANGDFQAVINAFNVVAGKFEPYKADNVQVISFLAAFSTEAESISAEAAGSFFGIFKANCEKAGTNGDDVINAMAPKDKAAFDAAVAKYYGFMTAPAQEEEVPAAEEGSEEAAAPAEGEAAAEDAPAAE